PHDQQQVIRCDEYDGDQRSGGTPAASWLRPKRHRDQSKCRAGHGKRNAAIPLNTRSAPPCRLVARKLAQWPLRIAELPWWHGQHSADLDGIVALPEGSDRVM